MSWIDSHLHLSRYDSTLAIDKVLTEARHLGGEFFLQGGIDPRDWGFQLVLNKKYPDLLGMSFGLHPWWIDTESQETLDFAILELTQLLPQAIALGELGLDFGKNTSSENHEKQIHFFKRQLSLAQSAQKPIVLHIVSAHSQAIEILKSHPNLSSGIVHSFSANLEIAYQYIELGLVLSVGPGLLGDGFFALKKMIGNIDLKHVVLETDAPDRLDSPSRIPEIAQAISELRQKESAQDILEITKNNFNRVFRRE